MSAIAKIRASNEPRMKSPSDLSVSSSVAGYDFSVWKISERAPMLASDEKLIKTDSCGFSIGRPLGQNFGGDWVELLADDVQRPVLNLRKYSTDIQTNQANTDDLYSEGNQPNRREREPAGQETEIGKPCDNEIDSHRQPDCGGGEAKGGHQLE